jgi:hypothetical protein
MEAAPEASFTKEPIITKVLDQPVISSVIEKKNIEIHNVPVVHETHLQKIVEIQKVPQERVVVQEPLYQQTTVAPIVQEVGTNELPQHVENEVRQLQQARPATVEKRDTIQQVQDKEQVTVINQSIIERHVVPTVTQVVEQSVIQTVEQPIIRTIHEAPIIREVTVAQPTTWTQPRTSYSSYDDVPIRGLSHSFKHIPKDTLNQQHLPSGKRSIGTANFLRRGTSRRMQAVNTRPTNNWRRGRLALQRKYRAFDPSLNSFKFASTEKTPLQAGYDQFRMKQQPRKLRRYYYPVGTVRNTGLNKASVLNWTRLYGHKGAKDLTRWRRTDPYIEYPTYVLDCDRKPGDPALLPGLSSAPEQHHATFKERMAKFRNSFKTKLHRGNTNEQPVAAEM